VLGRDDAEAGDVRAVHVRHGADARGRPHSTGTMSRRRAASSAPSSESRSQGCATAQVTGSSGSHCRSSRAKTSLRRRTISGVAMSEYESRAARRLDHRRAPQHATLADAGVTVEHHEAGTGVLLAHRDGGREILADLHYAGELELLGDDARARPGSLRSSSPEITALMPTASTHSRPVAVSPASSMWNGSMSPDTSTSASISVCVSARWALAVAPTLDLVERDVAVGAHERSIQVVFQFRVLVEGMQRL